MSRKPKVINIALLAIWCFLLLTSISPAGSPEELQKIERAMPAKATVVPKQPRKLLVFNLCKGFVHRSIPYGVKALEIMGRKSGAFEVVQSKDMSVFEPENLKQFDAVCFNNSTRLEFKDPALRKSLLDFVRSGKGVVGIHAAVDNFYDWPEAAEMLGGLFGGHPWNADGTWAVKIDEPNHPVVAAFKGEDFKINDEIYRIKAPYSRDKLRVLLSLDMTDQTNLKVEDIRPTDKDVPISWVRSYGKGRVFYCSLGHRKEIFQNPAVLRHYLDGIQFALGDLPADATPSGSDLQTLEKSLAVIAAYEYGRNSESLTELTDFVRLAYDSPQLLKQIEKRLLQFLRSDATLAGKQFVCKQLSIIGSEEAVPTLAAMLTETATSDMARYALERIPGLAVDEAFRKTLPKTSGKTKVGIINSLGQRRDAKSAAALRSLIHDSDPTIAAAAVAALGRIAGAEATEALAEAKEQTSGKLRLLVLDAYLKCADQLVARGEQSGALAIYRQLYAAGEPATVRIAALRGRVAAAGEKAGEIIVNVIEADDPVMQAAAIALVREISGTETTKALAESLGKLSAAGQVQLLSALADRGDRAALPAVVSATGSTDESVRIAALDALAALGDASSVNLLAQVAAATKGAEQKAARGSLYRLRGSKIDQTIMASIPQADPKVKVELIRSISHRNVYAAVKTLLKTAKDSEAKVRAESFKVLKTIADQKDLPALVNLLIDVQNGSVRNEAEGTVVAVANKIPDRNRRAEVVLAGLASVKEVTSRCSLLSVLGKIADDSSLPVLRRALKDKNAEVKGAAIRALSEWPTAEPAADLLKVVQTSDNQTHRVLALRGFVRLIGLGSNRPATETIKMYRQAMSLTSDVSEKKMVLAGLANIKSFAALQMAAALLEDEALQQEAEVAVVKIAEATCVSYPQQTRDILEKVLQVSRNDSLRKRAQEMINQIK